MKNDFDTSSGVQPAVTGAKAPEADDPMELAAVSVPLGELEAMSEAFVEEFARLGMSEEEIYLLFVRRCYFGTHLYFAKHGPQGTREMIRRVISRTGVYRYKEGEGDA